MFIQVAKTIPAKMDSCIYIILKDITQGAQWKTSRGVL